MGAFDFAPYSVGGALRPDSFTGMQPDFSSALASMFGAAPPEIQQNLRVSSGYRSLQRQTELWAQALRKYGSPSAARRWVAPPGRSQHNHGNAADLKFLNDQARQWAHQNAGQYGLAFPLGNENWHIELAGARGGRQRSAPMQHNQSITDMPPGPTGPAMGVAPVSRPMQPPGLGKMFAKTEAMPPELGLLALQFAQNARDRRQQEADEAAAEQARKNALFGGPSVFG